MDCLVYFLQLLLERVLQAVHCYFSYNYVQVKHYHEPKTNY